MLETLLLMFVKSPNFEMTQIYKWLISPCSASPSLAEEVTIWNEDHADYSKKIFSITQDPEICKKLIHSSDDHNILDSSEISILIPGCGSEIYLQNTILEHSPRIREVYSTDFSTDYASDRIFASSNLNLYFDMWQGIYQGSERPWLRWYDEAGNWLPTETEMAEQ